MAVAVAVSGDSLSSELFSDLAGYFSDPSDVDAFLVKHGVDARIASAVATAMAAATGTPVTIEGVTLTQLVQPFLPSVTLPASWSLITFSDLTFACSAQDQSLAFAGTCSAPLTVTCQNLKLDFTASLSLASSVSAGTRVVAGTLSGAIGFAGQDFSASFDFGSSGQILTAAWTSPGTGRLSLAAVLGQFELTAPAEATDDVLNLLALKSATFTLTLSDMNPQTLTVVAVSDQGDAFVIADWKDSWTVAAGLQLSNVTLDTVPLFGPAISDTAGDHLGFLLPAAVVLVATGQINQFVVPSPSADSVAWPFDPYPLDLQAGVTLAAILDLKGSSSPIVSNLASIVPAPSAAGAEAYLLLEATLPDLTLVVELGTKLKMLRSLSVDAMLKINADPFAVTIEGGVDVPPGSQLAGMQCNLLLTITPDSADGALDFEYSQGFNPPLPFMQGVWLYELAGMIGLDFTKQEATLGMMGKFDIGTMPAAGSEGNQYQSATSSLVTGVIGGQTQTAALDLDEFAIVVGVNDDAVVVPVPDLDLLILRLSTLSVQELLTAILGSDAPSVGASVLNDVVVNDLQIYWCDDAPGGLLLPDGTAPAPGFRFQGLFDFWNHKFEAWVDLQVGLGSEGSSTGVSGQLYLSPIDIGSMLKIDSDGSVSPPQSMLALMQQASITPGGPFLTFNTDPPTFLTASWKASLLEFSETVDVVVSSDGFTFTIKNQDSTNFSSDFSCSVTNDWKKVTLQFSGYLNGTLDLPVVVGIALGAVTVGKATELVISAGYSATMVVDVSDGFSLTIDGTFTFDGDTRQWGLPHIEIDEPLDSLADLPLKLLEAIGKDAEHVFADAIKAASSTIVRFFDKTWDEISSEVEAAYSDIKNAVERFFGIHKAKRPSVPWLANGALISAQGSSVLTDPSDPNYSPAAIYVVRNLQRVYVPDMPTLEQIDPAIASNDYSKVFSGSTDGFDPDLVTTIPPAAFEYPSVTDGTYFWGYDEKNPGTALYLAISYFHGTDQKVGHYQIASGKSVWPNAAAYTQQFDFAAAPQQKLPCNPGDTPDDGSTPLSAVSLVTNEDKIAQEVFFDGLRRLVPDMPTLAIVDKKKVGSLIELPTTAFDGIPSGPALTALSHGMLVSTDGNPAVYYISNNQLCEVPTTQDLYTWGLTGIEITTIDDQNMSVLTIGSALKSKPA